MRLYLSQSGRFVDFRVVGCEALCFEVANTIVANEESVVCGQDISRTVVRFGTTEGVTGSVGSESAVWFGAPFPYVLPVLRRLCPVSIWRRKSYINEMTLTSTRSPW